MEGGNLSVMERERQKAAWRLPDCLSHLRDEPRWCVWRWVARPDAKLGAKATKPPVQARGGTAGGTARNNDPATWATLAQACEALGEGGLDGIGLQLLDLKGFAAFDLDNVRDPDTGVLLGWAADLVARAGSYAEVTPSGAGLRILGRIAADAPPIHTKRPHPGGGEVEIYANTATGRYITVTGERLTDTPDDLASLDQLVAELSPVPLREPASPSAKSIAQDPSADVRHAVEALPPWLRRKIAEPEAQDRSSAFQSAVNGLRAQGMTQDMALRIFDAHHLGPAQKYAGRLPAELARSWNASERFQGAASIPGPYLDPEVQAAYVPVLGARAFSAATLHGRVVPKRRWLVPDLIPSATVTLFSGDGGTGKSLLALQLAVATATDETWITMKPHAGNAIYISAEDDQAELHRRAAAISQDQGCGLADMGRLTLASLAGEDALLAHLARSGGLVPTPLFDELDARVGDERPALLVLDTLADLFPGNENDRAQARQFIGMLRGLAIRHDVAVLVLSHPSLTGLSSGSGASGSTAWSNSVRSRLYLERIFQEGHEANPDARRLSTKKANYARTGGQFGLTWQDGCFVADAPVSGLDRHVASGLALSVFMKLLRLFTEQGRRVNPTSGANFAPRLFAEHPKSEGCNKRAFKIAMEAAFEANMIEVGSEGSPSRPKSFLREVGG